MNSATRDFEKNSIISYWIVALIIQLVLLELKEKCNFKQHERSGKNKKQKKYHIFKCIET